jgi:LPXTG-site transpeptidase (sortase) family protein
MREIWRYLLVTIGGPLLVVAILNIGLIAEVWKLWRVNTQDSPLPVIQEIDADMLFIPKLGVAAPLISSLHDPTAPWDDLRRDLDDGVSLAPGLSQPGQEGTAWVTGHSSDYAWRSGQYKTVFALLPALTQGDEIVIDYQGERYTYRVTGSEVVHPSNVAAFREREGATLTLMTCYPPLTTARRWLTYATLSL